MIDRISGIYSAPTRNVERVAEKNTPVVQAKASGMAGPQDMMASDSVKVASITGIADRTASYQLAVRNLDEISTYLSDLV